MLSQLRATVRWAVDSYVIFVVIGLVVGLTLAPTAMEVTGGADGTVAVVHIDGSINGEQAADYSSMLAEARSEADAVVIVANSGGGSAAASEEMYMQTKRTADQMPVVASVDAAAASGAYYAIAPADRIYAKPSSTVGSIGVIAPVPRNLEPNDIVGTTGPNKLTGGEGREFYHKLETVQNAFVGAVISQRGDRLELSESEVAEASVYVGATAVDNGLADEIGDRQQAIARAAEQAGLDRPEVEVLTPDDREATFVLRSTYLASEADQKELTDVDPFVETTGGPPPFLMVPPGTLATTDSEPLTAAEAERVVHSGDAAAAGGNDTDVPSLRPAASLVEPNARIERTPAPLVGGEFR